MSKEFSEPEENELNNTEDAEVVDNFNPLDEPVLEKPYTKHNVRVDAKDFQNDIPEPSFMPPPMTGALQPEEKVKKVEEPINMQMNDLPKKDKHDAAEKVADMILAGYKWANTFTDKQLLFDERKIAKLQREGEIDLSVEIPLSPTQTITAGEFIQEYNEQTEGTITVTKEFEDEVKPVLTRVLEKKGIGFTDEQYLYYLFGKDLLVKGFMVKQSLSVKKEMLNTLKEATAAMKSMSQPVFTPAPQQTYQPEPEPTPEPEPIRPTAPPRNPQTNVNDFVNEMTGGYIDEPVEEVEEYEEPQKPVVKILKSGNKPRRGRPRKK